MFKKISGVNKEQAVHSLKLWAICFFQYFSNRKLSRIIQFVERTTNTLDEKEQEEEKAMQTSVIGFPRIGTLRELKFASEKYFRNEIKAEELLQTAKDLRKAHWMTQKEAGITVYFQQRFFTLRSGTRYGRTAWNRSKTVSGAAVIRTGYLLCHGKRISGYIR